MIWIMMKQGDTTYLSVAPSEKYATASGYRAMKGIAHPLDRFAFLINTSTLIAWCSALQFQDSEAYNSCSLALSINKFREVPCKEDMPFRLCSEDLCRSSLELR